MRDLVMRFTEDPEWLPGDPASRSGASARTTAWPRRAARKQSADTGSLAIARALDDIPPCAIAPRLVQPSLWGLRVGSVDGEWLG